MTTNATTHPEYSGVITWLNEEVRDGEVVCDERLGGLLRYYRRAA